MNATLTESTMETTEEGGNPAFDRLAHIYRRLGLDPEQAVAATVADLACGWDIAGVALGTA
jgi:hypothetical protein